MLHFQLSEADKKSTFSGDKALSQDRGRRGIAIITLHRCCGGKKGYMAHGKPRGTSQEKETIDTEHGDGGNRRARGFVNRGTNGVGRFGSIVLPCEQSLPIFGRTTTAK